jgi:hypothetical protein
VKVVITTVRAVDCQSGPVEGAGPRRDRGRSARPPLLVCAARGGAWRQGRGEGFARRLINEDAALTAHRGVHCNGYGAPREAGCLPWVVLGVEAVDAPSVRAA